MENNTIPSVDDNTEDLTYIRSNDDTHITEKTEELTTPSDEPSMKTDEFPTSATTGKSATRSKSKIISSTNRKIAKTRSQASNGVLQARIEEMSPFLGDKLMKVKSFNEKMTLKDLSTNTAMMLISHYKMTDDNIINSALLATTDPVNYKRKTSFNKKFGNIKIGLGQLEPMMKLLVDKSNKNMFNKDSIKDIFSNLEKLDVTSNIVMQSLILTLAISITGQKPAGLNLKIPTGIKMSRPEVRQRLALLLTVSQVLYQRCKSLKVKESNKVDNMHKDLVKIAARYKS